MFIRGYEISLTRSYCPFCGVFHLWTVLFSIDNHKDGVTNLTRNLRLESFPPHFPPSIGRYLREDLSPFPCHLGVGHAHLRTSDNLTQAPFPPQPLGDHAQPTEIHDLM